MTHEQDQEETTEEKSPRRKFLVKLWIALGFIAFAELLWVILSYLKPVKSSKRTGEFGTLMKAGAVETYLPNSVTAFPRGHFYLACLEDGGFLAIHRKCTHLGCTVPWMDEQEQFICPCHSSAFDIRGEIIRSPANRAMDIFPVIIENNVVFVDTSRMITRIGFKPGQVVYPKS
jgi:nitrite reductase/ring-hydroxylating ferredoxin subunit